MKSSNNSNNNKIMINSTNYETKHEIKEQGYGKYISYTISSKEPKKHKETELYIDSLSQHFGPLPAEIIGSSDKQIIADDPDINYNDKNPRPAIWQNNNTFNGIEHVTFGFYEHGIQEQRKFNIYEDTIKKNIDTISNDVFSKLKSFYFKSYGCHGAYHDSSSCIFEELQQKIKNCGNENVECFVSMLKSQYEIILGRWKSTSGENLSGIIRTPTKNNTNFNLDKIRQNKDDYFDYYYIKKDAIYKVPHSLVKNRVELIDSGKFQEEFEKLNLKPVDKYKEFHEYYENKYCGRPKKPLGDLDDDPCEEDDDIKVENKKEISNKKENLNIETVSNNVNRKNVSNNVHFSENTCRRRKRSNDCCCCKG